MKRELAYAAAVFETGADLMRAMLSLIVLLAGIGLPAAAQPLSGPALVAALQKGGYVLVMRHANSPAAVPSRSEADPENTGLERQLDAAGRDSAIAMGKAFATLRIPLAANQSSPTYRARLTAKLAGFAVSPHEELDEGAAGMEASAEKARADYLRLQANTPPPTGENRLLVSHAPNITGAFGKDAANVASGETLVFSPGAGGPSLIARVKIEEWPRLAAGN